MPRLRRKSHYRGDVSVTAAMSHASASLIPPSIEIVNPPLLRSPIADTRTMSTWKSTAGTGGCGETLEKHSFQTASQDAWSRIVWPRRSPIPRKAAAKLADTAFGVAGRTS